MPSTHVSLTYHLIFSTKDREPLIERPWRERLHAMLGGCTRTARGVALEVGGTHDHVHMLVGLKATHCVADFVRDIKHATSSWVHDTIRMRAFEWQVGYGAFTLSAYDMEGLRTYIKGQDDHHRIRTFMDEYREFIERHGIEFDERYLW